MKKLSLFLVFSFFLTAASFIACKKEDTTQSTNEVVLNLRANKTPLSQLVLNAKDKEDEFINKKNVELCNILKTLMIRKDINKFVVETAKKNDGNVTYDQFFAQFPTIKPLFGNTIVGEREKLSLKTNSGNPYDFIHNDIAYQALIYVPNHVNCNWTDKVILSPEIQIYEEIGEGDIYFAWDLKDGQETKEIFINEKESKQTTVPVVVTSLLHIDFLKPFQLKEHKAGETYSFQMADKNKLQSRANWDESVWVRRGNLLYNYDGGTNSELYVTGAFIQNDGQWGNWSRIGQECFYASDHEQTCNLIGTDKDNLYTNFNPNGNDPNFWTKQKYFFNAWEYDWGSSNKSLGEASHAGRKAFFKGCRKFTEEWYIYHPGRVQTEIDALPMTFLFNNTGAAAFPLPDPDPNSPSNNDCHPNSSSKNLGIKADLAFTRGWF